MNTQFEYNGLCAFALSVGKTDVPGVSKHFANINGKYYCFSNIIAKWLFKLLPSSITKAEQNWANIPN